MKKLQKVGILACALVLSLVVAGCENGIQEIEGNVGINTNKAPQVSSVTVTKTTDGQYYIVSWDAVAEDVSYALYFKQEGKKSSINTSGNPQNAQKFATADGAPSVNDDSDKWSVRITSTPATFAGSFSYGVRTSSSSGSVVTSAPSDIKWSAPFALTAGPVVTNVTLAKAASSGRYDVSFNAPTPPSGVGYNYTIEIYRGTSWAGSDNTSSTVGGALSVSNVWGSFVTDSSYTAKVRISGAYYTTTPYPYGSPTCYDISKVPVDAESPALDGGATW
ncbi:hypothetical protein FACS189483_00340 [Spirochaetia bacterium]|nr:hypothetical protein FACS189483_00340 [Spirochaetia bacterium]